MKIFLIFTLLLSLSACAIPVNKYKDKGPISPFEQVVMAQKHTLASNELSNISITQSLDSIENPQKVYITVLQTDLLDDSVSSSKNIYTFIKKNDTWNLSNIKNTYKCRRNNFFQEKNCS